MRSILEKELNNLKINEPLAPYTTFLIGGPARFFYQAESAGEIEKAVRLAESLKIKYFILGGGSNLLVSDIGFKGLVITLYAKPYTLNAGKITASAGVRLSELVDASIRAGLSGLEWAAGIPGTLSGAIRGNAGAFGGSMSDIVSRVRIFSPSRFSSPCQGEGRKGFLWKRVSKFDWGYRQSPFSKTRDIILEAELRLKKGDKNESRKIVHEYLKKRRISQPTEFPSAGCVFKNLQITTNNLQQLLRQYPEAERFATVKAVPAGWLIEKCGLKGKKIGGAMVSAKHANFIVNAGGARAKDVKNLIDLIKKEVKKKFNLSLEAEIQFLV